MKRLKLTWILLTAVLFMPLATVAQFMYTHKELNINNATPHPYMAWTINEWAGLYWTHTPTKFLQIDLSAEHPRFAGTKDKIVFYNSNTKRYNDIECGSIFNYSDAKAKDDVQTLSSGLSTILRLRPVTYKWKEQNEEPVMMTSALSGDSTTVSYGPAEDTHTQIGFIAQEVEEVLPEAVQTNDSGDKLVNYIALIPMLVQSVQELQATVEAQAQIIAALTTDKMTSTNIDSKNKILSCSPNPATSYVDIMLQLDSEIKNVMVTIASISGNRELQTVVDPLQSNVTIDVSSIPNGLHIVSLYVDGILADSSRLYKE